MVAWLRQFCNGGGFAAKVAVLAGGTVAGQTVVFLSTPLVTRVYEPADFGVLSAFVTLLSLCSIAACLRYELAIPLPPEDTEGANVLGLCLVLLPCLSAGVAVAIWLCGDQLARLTQCQGLEHYLWLLPLGILGAGLYQAFSMWAVRQGAYANVAQTKVAQGCGLSIGQFGFHFVFLGPLGLILGYMAGQACGGLYLARKSWISDFHTLKTVSRIGIAQVARRYRKFPQYTIAAGFLNSAGAVVPPLAFLLLFGPELTGLLYLALRVITLPAALIGQAAAQAFLSEGARLAQNDPLALYRLSMRTSSRLLLIAIVPAGTLMLAGPHLFRLVFGENWAEAGNYARVLAIMAVAQLALAPISQVANLLDRQGTQLCLDLSRLLLVVLGFTIAHAVGASPATAVGFFSLAMTLSYALSFPFYRALLRHALDRYEDPTICHTESNSPNSRPKNGGQAPGGRRPRPLRLPEHTTTPDHWSSGTVPGPPLPP